MCGIAGIYLRQPFKDHEQLEKFVDTLFEGIEHRGRRATGFVAVGPGGHQVTLDKKATNASTFIKTRKQLPENAMTVLCHTRLDTKGSPSNPANNHPIVYRSTFVIHNGGIWNDDTLFEEKELRRNGQVDSEIIAALIAEETMASPKAALEALEGDFAIAAIDPINEPGKLLLAKGAWSPLITWENDFGIVWASTEGTIKKACEAVGVKPPESKDMYEFDTGEMWTITEDSIEKDSFISKVDDWESGAKKDAKKAARTAQSGGATYGNAQTGYWVSCDACKHHVPYKEIRRDNLRGMLCEDCDTLGLGKRTATADGNGNADLLLITDDEKRILETWTKTDQELHSRIVSEMAKDTGFSEAAVEWLVFRAPQPYLRNHKNMGELADFLDEIYQERLIKEWENFNQITMEAAEKKEKVTDSEDSYTYDDWSDPTDPDLEAIEKGESCGVEVVKDDTSNVVPFRKALPPGRRNDFSCFAGETYRTDCKVCLQDAETQLGIFAYCHKHFDTCNAKDCKVGGGAATGTDTTGRRLCHGCARGTKGFLADSLLDLNGFVAKPVRT